MPDYKDMYFQLAASVADAVDILVKALQQGEEAYIAEGDESPIIKLLEYRRDSNKEDAE